MKKRYSFRDVLVNGDDQVIVRELLQKHVPDEVQIKIVNLFNQECDERERRRKNAESTDS